MVLIVCVAIWRSLLKGVGRKQSLLIAKLQPEQVPLALERVKRWYRQRIATYKREHPQVPQVVRPVAASPRHRDGFIGLGRKHSGS